MGRDERFYGRPASNFGHLVRRADGLTDRRVDVHSRLAVEAGKLPQPPQGLADVYRGWQTTPFRRDRHEARKQNEMEILSSSWIAILCAHHSNMTPA